MEDGRSLWREVLTTSARVHARGTGLSLPRGRRDGELIAGAVNAGGGGAHQQVASLMPASWNQAAVWLKQIDALRQTA